MTHLSFEQSAVRRAAWVAACAAELAPGVPSTPPVENSNPEGGPKGADGQGVCTFMLHMSWPAEFENFPECCGAVNWEQAALFVGRALEDGATTVTVELL